MRFIVIIGIVFMVISCGPTEWYNHEVEMPDSGWHKDTVAVFKSEITELNKACHILLQIRNNASYQYSNMWFFVDAISPGGHVQRDTLECSIVDFQGKWIGKSEGQASKSIHPYKLNVKFPEKGLYKYYVIQGMRDTVITGVESVGVKIIEVE